jgi:hypothetical protein
MWDIFKIIYIYIYFIYILLELNHLSVRKIKYSIESLKEGRISIIGPKGCTVCLQFITINSLYMFRAVIFSSSGGTVYTTIVIFCVYYIEWLPAELEWTFGYTVSPDDEQISIGNV